MTLSEFKDTIVIPVKKTMEQSKAATLAQFKSLDDIKIQWCRAEGMEMVLNHIETVYAQSQNAPAEPTIEILPPESGQ